MLYYSLTRIAQKENGSGRKRKIVSPAILTHPDMQHEEHQLRMSILQEQLETEKLRKTDTTKRVGTTGNMNLHW